VWLRAVWSIDHSEGKFNYLYTNGVITYEKEGRLEYYIRFSSLRVQKRLFNYFARELFPELGRVYAPL